MLETWHYCFHTYKPRHSENRGAPVDGANGQQSGHRAKLAKALVTIAHDEKLVLRFPAGADSVPTAEQVATTLLQQANAYHEIFNSMAFEKM